MLFSDEMKSIQNSMKQQMIPLQYSPHEFQYKNIQHFFSVLFDTDRDACITKICYNGGTSSHQCLSIIHFSQGVFAGINFEERTVREKMQDTKCQFFENLSNIGLMAPYMVSEIKSLEFFCSINTEYVISLNTKFNSTLLETNKLKATLLRLCGFYGSTKLKLVYRGARDHFISESFHSRCNGIRNTLTLVESEHFWWIQNKGWNFGSNRSIFNTSRRIHIQLSK